MTNQKISNLKDIISLLESSIKSTRPLVIIPDDVTVYRKVDDSIMVNIKKDSKKWWIKRKEAHEFMRNFFLKNQLVYENKFDYYLTDKISKFCGC